MTGSMYWSMSRQKQILHLNSIDSIEFSEFRESDKSMKQELGSI